MVRAAVLVTVVGRRAGASAAEEPEVVHVDQPVTRAEWDSSAWRSPANLSVRSFQGQPGERGEDGLPGKPGPRVWTRPPPRPWGLLCVVFQVV